MKTGDIIKLLRERKGMNQTDLANALKLSRSAVSMYESNNRVPSTYVLQDLCDLFNVDADYLLGKTTKTTVLPERIGYENKQILYKSADFTLISPTRVLKDGAAELIGDQLLAMTMPIESKPSRLYMINWLRDNIRTAAFGGGNYEEMDDQSLYEYYMDIRKEVDDEERRN